MGSAFLESCHLHRRDDWLAGDERPSSLGGGKSRELKLFVKSEILQVVWISYPVVVFSAAFEQASQLANK